MQVLQLCTGTIPRVIDVERFGKGSPGAAVSWVEGHFLESEVHAGTLQLCETGRAGEGTTGEFQGGQRRQEREVEGGEHENSDA